MHNNNETSKSNNCQDTSLLTLYNVIDWIDFILVFIIIIYIGISPIAIDFYNLAYLNMADIWYTIVNNLSVVDLLLCLASLIVTIAAITTAILIYKKGLNKNPLRLILRFIVWGVWIPIDLYLIFMATQGLFF